MDSAHMLIQRVWELIVAHILKKLNHSVSHPFKGENMSVLLVQNYHLAAKTRW